MSQEILSKLTKVFANQQKILEKLAQTSQQSLTDKVGQLRKIYAQQNIRNLSEQQLEELFNRLHSSSLTPEETAKYTQLVDQDIAAIRSLFQGL